jgi:prevent-host-death family protein
MQKIPITTLRNNIFKYLDQVVDQKQPIALTKNKKVVAYITPQKPKNWRKAIKTRVTLLVDPEKIIEPMDDIWEQYT